MYDAFSAGSHKARQTDILNDIHAMQGEVDVILDLVSGVEDGQHLAIGMVAPSQKSLQMQNRERGLALAAKRAQLQVQMQPTDSLEGMSNLMCPSKPYSAWDMCCWKMAAWISAIQDKLGRRTAGSGQNAC